MNRGPTRSGPTGLGHVGPPIHGGRNATDNRNDPEGSNIDIQNNKPAGGVTGEHNPMLYEIHLGKIIRWYKGRCTFEIRKRGHSDFAWQPRFYDHIIRNDKSLQRIREYIFDNPLRWQMDREHPGRVHEQAVEYMVAV